MHSNAAGCRIPKLKVEEAIKRCNEMLPVEDATQKTYSVDWEIPADKLKQNYLIEVADNENVWGNTVPRPLFIITGLKINASQIQAYGANASFIRFDYNGITFVKKYCHSSEFNTMTMCSDDDFGISHKDLLMNVICEFGVSRDGDNKYYECIITDYDVIEDPDSKQEDSVPWEEEVKQTIKVKNKTNDDELDW